MQGGEVLSAGMTGGCGQWRPREANDQCEPGGNGCRRGELRPGCGAGRARPGAIVQGPQGGTRPILIDSRLSAAAILVEPAATHAAGSGLGRGKERGNGSCRERKTRRNQQPDECYCGGTHKPLHHCRHFNRILTQATSPRKVRNVLRKVLDDVDFDERVAGDASGCRESPTPGVNSQLDRLAHNAPELSCAAIRCAKTGARPARPIRAPGARPC